MTAGASSPHDLAIWGGTIVSAAGREEATLYVRHGRVAEVTRDPRPAVDHVDATGLLVLPGFVDAHVHFMDPAEPTREDFPAGSAAAACAGVTTVIEHTHASPVRTPRDLEGKVAYLADRSVVDYALAAHAWPGDAGAAIATWRAGAAFIKAFTCTTHGVPGHNAAALLDLLDAAAAAGATCLLHCEDEAITQAAEKRLRDHGRFDGGVVSEWRSEVAEQVAVAVAAVLARRTGARAVLAHASNVGVLELARGLLVETCPQYLLLLEIEAEQQGPLRKFTPPARAHSAGSLELMWEAVRSGKIDYVSSDHAPSTRAQKSAGSIWEAPFGLPGIDTTSAVLLEGAYAGRLSYERVVEVYAEAPARIYGLANKGRLTIGADADVALIDPDLPWPVADSDIHSRAGWSPFAGRTLHGRPRQTFLRGKLVARDGNVVAAAGTGRFVPGAGLPVRSPGRSTQGTVISDRGTAN